MFDIEIEGIFNYEKFRTLCVRLFGADEIDQHEWRAQEIFELFDANADGALDSLGLRR